MLKQVEHESVCSKRSLFLKGDAWKIPETFLFLFATSNTTNTINSLNHPIGQ